jgi:S-adenosylmethionine decarboxylase
MLDWKESQYDFFHCNIERVKADIGMLIKKHGMTTLEVASRDFGSPIWAFTCIFLLGESHMSIHTFPEERYIAIDLFVCNMSRDSSSDARECIDECIKYFSIRDPHITEIKR